LSVNVDPRAFLIGLFRQAVAAVHPSRIVPPHLPSSPPGRTVVIGAGKASAAMAQAAEGHWGKEISGLVVTRYGYGVPCRRIEVVEAAHPVPNAAGLHATERMLALLRGLAADDLVLALISGGGSSLLLAPAPGITLSDKQAVTQALLKSGAPIAAMNCVRKHLSAVKGGRLALAAAPARVAALILSDVPGDDPATVASGPTVPDPTSRADALAVLESYRIAVPVSVLRWLGDPRSETPDPGDPRFARVTNQVIGSGEGALRAAAVAAKRQGCRVVSLGDALEGESRALGRAHAALALARGCEPRAQPLVILSGGETTVTVTGDGRGGRNGEYALGLALGLQGAQNVWALACDTDGIDGTEDDAGAIVAPDTLARARALGLDPAAALARNDSFGVFQGLGDLVRTGPTCTNVNDFRAILILPSQ
jgi:glycerate 2-kinase